MSDNLQEIVERVKAGSRNETDIQALATAIQTGKLVLASAPGAVGVGGDVSNSQVVAGHKNVIGDGNIVIYGADAQIIQSVLSHRSGSGQSASFTSLSLFQSLIQDKTEGFVGREYVFDAIQAFIQENKKGYFTIIGDPGQGKSAILAKYVQDTGCIAHFNVQLQGPNRANQFLESVCKQLVARYELPYDPLPSNATQDGEFLGQLLDEVAQRRNGKPVVIAVDALDEVDSGSYRDANILYLPPHLPEGAYFIMTLRRDVNVLFTTYTPEKIINLLDEQYQADSKRDIRRYIQNCINNSNKLQQQIEERDESIPIFIDKITEKSETNFMYLHHILKNIESGLYKHLNLEHFPQGLQRYYNFHWQRMGMMEKNDEKGNKVPPPVEKIKIIYILAEVCQPVSAKKVCDFSNESGYTVETVLVEWAQFLHKLPRDGQIRYTIYHASFRDFLHQKDILASHPITLQKVHELIAIDQLSVWDKFKAYKKLGRRE